MTAERGSGPGSRRMLRSSSTASSLAFVDVAFSDLPLSPDETEDATFNLNDFGAGASLEAAEAPLPAASVARHQHPEAFSRGASMGSALVGTPRPSLASRFFLREFYCGDAQDASPKDVEELSDCRISSASTSCDGHVSSCYSSDAAACGSVGAAREHQRRHPKWTPSPRLSVFAVDPTDGIACPKATAWRMVWSAGLLLLLASMTIAAFSQLMVSCMLRESRGAAGASLEEEGRETSKLSATQWLPTQAAVDGVYVLLVVLSLYRWKSLQPRLRAAVLLRFGGCLCAGLILKLFISVAFGFEYSSQRSSNSGGGSFTYRDTAMLTLRFLGGLALPEDVDGVPGYSRLILSELCVFWLLYTWQRPLLLLQPALLSLVVVILSSVSGLRSVFDAIVSFFIVAVVTVSYHLLLDAAARQLFVKLRAQVGTREVQQQHWLRCKGSPESPPNTALSSPVCFYPSGGFVSHKVCSTLSSWISRLELLEERARYTLHSCGLYLAQQHSVRFVPRMLPSDASFEGPSARPNNQEEGRGLPVASQCPPSEAVAIAEAPASEKEAATGTLVDDRMVWLAIRECYAPIRRLPPCGCRAHKEAAGGCCFPKRFLREKPVGAVALPGVCPQAP
ncbi:hypothetical protein cyc_05805 [Cyclospora cayetanensis]|uniref:Transmembrane protein n=1 Tax=Cyclospora cayetanensis TaxID=88456 RepID=A0A1D3CVN0_9EIME|nr:hypothetical protein cyc_05805 [Cyclospora cayetanensis]